MEKNLNPGFRYRAFGRIGFYNGEAQLTHPEIEGLDDLKTDSSPLQPVYPSTEKLKARSLGGRQIAKLTRNCFTQLKERDIPEFIPSEICRETGLISRFQAFQSIHFPAHARLLIQKALFRLKFEELFLNQVRTGMIKTQRQKRSKGVIFSRVGRFFNDFYTNALPFELTGAQKRVIKEIRQDTATGHQMNRLLQGDVGSGKTMVALLTMLLAADNGFQSCLMAPTEILSNQHTLQFPRNVKRPAVKCQASYRIGEICCQKKNPGRACTGEINILIGTHAILEEPVKFHNFGLAIIDEQHRFGVAQTGQDLEKGSSSSSCSGHDCHTDSQDPGHDSLQRFGL